MIRFRLVPIVALLGTSTLSAQQLPWPPMKSLIGARSEAFLQVPEAVRKEGSAGFILAKTPPTVDLVFHDQLGPDAANRRLWSSWGDICVARGDRVYVGIGDHGNDVGGDARCFLYRWDPNRKSLDQIVDMNQIVPREEGVPAWSKVHAKIDEGADGKIYFSCTLNDGNKAGAANVKWSANTPGGQIYQFDPATGKTIVHANLPPRRCTATSCLDRERNIWWCNLEAGQGNALWGFDLTNKKEVYKGADGSVTFNRNFALLRDGSIVYNGEGGLWLLDAKTRQVKQTKGFLGKSPGMRASTEETKDGRIFGCTHGTNELFVYDRAKDELKMLGPNWLTGAYTTVMVLSPDERFVYYLPGAHGGAFKQGTPVIQYDIAAGKQKVLAFLAPFFQTEIGYVPAGTYGAKLSADGATLFVNFNGHAVDQFRPKKLGAIGFGLCSFAAIHIPASER